MFQYMNFGRAYYLPVLLISVRFNYSIFPADFIEKHYVQDNFPYFKDIILKENKG